MASSRTPSGDKEERKKNRELFKVKFKGVGGCMNNRKRTHRSGAICRMRWPGDVSGARPRHDPGHDRTGLCAKKMCKNIEMAANASVFQLCVGVVRPWPERAVAARLLPGSCPVPAQRPVAARLLPGFCPTAGQDPPRSGGSCAGAGQQPAAPLSGAAPRLCGCFLCPPGTFLGSRFPDVIVTGDRRC